MKWYGVSAWGWIEDDTGRELQDPFSRSEGKAEDNSADFWLGQILQWLFLTCSQLKGRKSSSKPEEKDRVPEILPDFSQLLSSSLIKDNNSSSQPCLAQSLKTPELQQCYYNKGNESSIRASVSARDLQKKKSAYSFILVFSWKALLPAPNDIKKLKPNQNCGFLKFKNLGANGWKIHLHK